MVNVDFRRYVLGQFEFAHTTIEQVIEGCDGFLNDRPTPGATGNSVSATYAHAVMTEDFILNGMVLGGTPIFFAGGWAEKTGVPGKPSPQLEEAWAASIKMNLPAFREYAAQVYARTVEQVGGGMDDSAAERIIDTPFGNKQAALEFVANLGIVHMWGHLGEIASMKGLRGLKGLPF